MIVAELDAKGADVILRKMYYHQDSSLEFDTEDSDFEYEDEHWSELAYSLGSTWRWNSETKTREEIAPGQDFEGVRVMCVQDVGGGEGDGELRYAVYSFTDKTGTKYFRKDGYYASYDGTTWDGAFREVTPHERVVIFYE
jgi:hypothetical protein